MRQRAIWVRLILWLIKPPRDPSVFGRFVRTAAWCLLWLIVPLLFLLSLAFLIPHGILQNIRYARYQNRLRAWERTLAREGRLIGFEELMARLDRGEGALVLVPWMCGLTEAPSERQVNWNDVWWLPQEPQQASASTFTDAKSLLRPLQDMIVPPAALEATSDSSATFQLTREMQAFWIENVLKAKATRCQAPYLAFDSDGDDGGTEIIAAEWRWYRERFPQRPLILIPL